MAALQGTDSATLDSRISAAMQDKFLTLYSHMLDDTFTQEQLGKTCSAENIAAAQVYLDKSGTLRVLCNIYSIAGADYYEYPLILE